MDKYVTLDELFVSTAAKIGSKDILNKVSYKALSFLKLVLRNDFFDLPIWENNGVSCTEGKYVDIPYYQGSGMYMVNNKVPLFTVYEKEKDMSYYCPYNIEAEYTCDEDEEIFIKITLRDQRLGGSLLYTLLDFNTQTKLISSYFKDVNKKTLTDILKELK